MTTIAPAANPVLSHDVAGHAAEWSGATYKLTIGEGHEVYMMISDASPTECAKVAIRSHKMGSEMQGGFAALAKLVTLALESRVSTLRIVEEMIGVVCDPKGLVCGHPEIQFASSPADLLGRVLAHRYGIAVPAVTLGLPPSRPLLQTSPAAALPAVAAMGFEMLKVEEPAAPTEPLPPPSPATLAPVDLTGLTRCPRCGHDPHQPGACKNVWCRPKNGCSGVR